MKRILISLFVLSLILRQQLSAQTADHDSLFALAGVSSVKTIVVLNGDTTFRERKSYDRDGSNTSFHYSSTNQKYHIVINDTFITRNAEYKSCISSGNHRFSDSSHAIISSGISDTTTITYFKKKKVVSRTLIVHSKEQDRIYQLYYRRHKITGSVQTEIRHYDREGVLSDKMTTDSSVDGNVRLWKASAHTYYSYEADHTLLLSYHDMGDSTEEVYYTFHYLDGSHDSTAVYFVTERPSNFFAIYYDSLGRDTLSVYRNSSEIVTNRNHTVYSKDYIITEHADGTGTVFKTHEWFLNEKGLVTKEIETDHKSGDVRILYYEYSYY
jgi:hypothetical protein